MKTDDEGDRKRERERKRKGEREGGMGEGQHFPHYPDCLPRLRYLHLAHTGSERRQAAQSPRWPHCASTVPALCTVRRASLLNSVKLHATKHLTAQKLDQQREGGGGSGCRGGRGCKLHKTCNRTRRRRRRHCPTVVNDGRQKTQM